MIQRKAISSLHLLSVCVAASFHALMASAPINEKLFEEKDFIRSESERIIRESSGTQELNLSFNLHITPSILESIFNTLDANGIPEKIKSINLNGCPNLSSLPSNIQNFKSLEVLYASGCPLETLPKEIENLHSLFYIYRPRTMNAHQGVLVWMV